MTAALLEAPAIPADDVTKHRKQWIAALRSGEYTQSKGCLRNAKGYCCLGVATDVAIKAGVPMAFAQTDDSEGSFKYREIGAEDHGAWWMGSLPPLVAEWLGLPPAAENVVWDPDLNEWGARVSPDNAITANDSNGWTFTEIADKLEKHWGLTNA